MTSDGPYLTEHPTRTELFSDAAAIEYGIREAQRDARPVDDATARRVAMQLHAGQASALYSFGSSGAIDRERMLAEASRNFSEFLGDDEALRWLGSLISYASTREDRGPQPAWHELTADDVPVVAWVEVSHG